MFNKKNNECVGFESRWRITKVSSAASTQTTEFSTSEVSSDTFPRTTVDVQTDFHEVKEDPKFDEERLAAWLKRIMPQVKEELYEAIHCKAFKGYKVSSDTSDANCKILQTITVKPDAVGSSVSSLCWNCNGRILAAACCFSHSFWCTHEGCVYIYPLEKEDRFSEKPKFKLTTDACVVNLHFHCEIPHILSAATYTGEIITWSIQNDTPEILVKVNGHNGIITQLKWVNTFDTDNLCYLISSGGDELMKVWSFNVKNSKLDIKTKYVLKSPILNRYPNADVDQALDEELKEKMKTQEIKAVRSVLCFDFSKFFPGKFVVGTEGGLVIECSTLGTNPVRGNSETDPLTDPVYQYYAPHKGEITSIKFSPNIRDLFMTCATDGEIRVYVLGQEDAAQVMFARKTLGSIIWVPFEEKIIAGCGMLNIIEIYNLVEAKRIENTTTEKIKQGKLTVMEINNKKSNLVVTGNDCGKIFFWKIPWALFGNM